jgi:GNAT superfamily N-acetyltransferase
MSVEGQDTDISQVSIRIAATTDVAYIFRRSLQDLRHCPAFNGCGNGIFHQYMHRAMEHTLMRTINYVAYPSPTTITVQGQSMVKHPDSRKILGFLVADPFDLGVNIFTLNVRRTYNGDGVLIEDYRRRGIARKLIETMIREYKLPTNKVIYGFETPIFRYETGFKRRVYDDKDITCNPFLWHTLLHEGWETGVKRKPSEQYMHGVVNP